MTETLKKMLDEQAGTREFAPVDLGAIVSGGNRRLRRRGIGLGAGAAAVAATALLVSQLVGGPVVRELAPAVDPNQDVREVSWSVGTVIHEGGTRTDVGHVVDAYVQTSRGFVVADPGGTVWSVDGGAVSRIGTTPAQGMRLVSDPTGQYAGWVEVVDGQPGFMVHDQAAGTTVRHDEFTEPGQNTLADTADPAYFYAIDGTTAYWRDTRGAVAVDLTTAAGDAGVVDADALNGFDIAAVGDGLIAFSGQGTQIGTSREDTVDLPEAYGSVGVFSPDAQFYSSEGDEPSVWDLSTRERVEIAGLADYPFASGYAWLDDDTLAFIAMERPQGGDLEILTCGVPAGACTQVTTLDRGDTFRLPTGSSLG